MTIWTTGKTNKTIMRSITADVLVSVLFVLLLFTTTTFVEVEGASKIQAYKLYDDVLGSSGYNKYVRPTNDTTVATEIFMTFSLVSLIEVDEKNQRLKTSAKLELEWTDTLLAWNPSNPSYGGLEELFTHQEKLWIPDLAVDNSVVQQKQMGFDELMVRVSNLGVVLWTPTVLVSTTCDIEVTYYPFDTQICHIDYVTLVSNYQEVDISIDKDDPVNTNDYSKDGTWVLIDYHATNMGNEDSKTKIRFSLLLRRRTTFYIINLILPVLFLSLTASLVFALPAESGEKMGTSITVLLAYAVYLTIVTAYLPNTSLQTSILALYLTLLLGFTACSVVVTGFILRIYNKPDTDPVGSHVVKSTLFLRSMMCMRKKGSEEPQPTPKNKVSPKDEKEPPKRGGNNNRKDSSVSDPPHYDEHVSWKIVAETLDWMCFILFTMLILVTTVVCMTFLAVGGTQDAPTINKT